MFGFGMGMMLSSFHMYGMMLVLRANMYSCMRRAYEVLGVQVCDIKLIRTRCVIDFTVVDGFLDL